MAQCSDLNENLLLHLTPWLRRSNTRVVLNLGEVDDKVHIAPEVATAFRFVAQAWMESFFAKKLENIQDVHTANETHLNLGWSVRQVKGRLRFEFSDDSDSVDEVKLDIKRFAHLGLAIEVTRDGSNRKLLMHCDHRSLHEYLVVRQLVQGQTQLFGISTNYVIRVERNVSVIELDASNRLVSLNSSQNLPLVRLCDSVGSVSNAGQNRLSYLVIDDGVRSQFVVEVEEVIGIVRGALKPGTGIKESKTCLGVIIGRDSLINIIDVFSLRTVA